MTKPSHPTVVQDAVTMIEKMVGDKESLKPEYAQALVELHERVQAEGVESITPAEGFWLGSIWASFCVAEVSRPPMLMLDPSHLDSFFAGLGVPEDDELDQAATHEADRSKVS